MTETARNEDWGQLGAAMRALPNENWRRFVVNYVRSPRGHGSLTRACRAAGFGTKSTPGNTAKIAWKISRDERFINAVAEESKKLVRIGHPEAANALLAMVRDPKHRDHARAVGMVLQRTDPEVTRSVVDVTVSVQDPDREALEELRALRSLNTSHEKLVELFGTNGLDRLEMLEAAETNNRAAAAKVIDARPIDEEHHGS